MARRASGVPAPNRLWRQWPDDAEPTSAVPGLEAALALRQVVESLLAERLARGWSRPRLARAAGVTPQTVWNIENGYTWPDWVTLHGLLSALGLDLRPSAGAV